MSFSPSIQEEQLKSEMASTIFHLYDCTRIIGKIDFCVAPHTKKQKGKDQNRTPETTAPYLWAEVKRGKAKLEKALIQLILTIGGSDILEHSLPPIYLGAFNAEEIILIPYEKIQSFFMLNDFNWNVAPSDQSTREFRDLMARVQSTFATEKLRFRFDKDEKLLRAFIRQNLKIRADEQPQIEIDHNNFFHIYLQWRLIMVPHRNGKGQTLPGALDAKWDGLQKKGILESDLFLADLFVDGKSTIEISDDETIRENLIISFRSMGYRTSRGDTNLVDDLRFDIRDRQAYTNFWKRFKRPPRKESQQEIIDRRDRLVPQDVRERKGAFFTPQQWVELSQRYLADYLGPSWQDEYYVWDCAAGTGNLLVGLTNPDRVWASTIDRADVLVMHDRISNGALLHKHHAFQFDFLNDSFDGLPPELRSIVQDPEKRKKLVIYINPPYAEGDSRAGDGRSGVHQSATHDRYIQDIGSAASEIFALFLIRIYREIPGCVLGDFSILKNLQAPKFAAFRKEYRAKLEKIFLCPAYTFDNVKGKFPISFSIWQTDKEEPFERIRADVYDAEGQRVAGKTIVGYDGRPLLSSWLGRTAKAPQKPLGRMASVGSDFQNQRTVFIENVERRKKRGGRHTPIDQSNTIIIAICFAVRHCIPATWLNDRDQFLWPSDAWLEDREFQGDCLAYTLFHGQNCISAEDGVNHWIPFAEHEVGLEASYGSHFLLDFIAGRLPAPDGDAALIADGKPGDFTRGEKPITFSPEAQVVLQAGRALYTYYHQQHGAKPNASYYDIRRFFQGVSRTEQAKPGETVVKGRMNAKSDDAEYMRLIGELKQASKHLGYTKIAPKVYEYGFLLG